MKLLAHRVDGDVSLWASFCNQKRTVLGNRGKPVSLSPPNSNPGGCKESSVFGEESGPSFRKETECVCKQSGNLLAELLGPRRERVTGPGWTGEVFQSHKLIQKEWGKILRNLEESVFQFVPGDLCISETLINVCWIIYSGAFSLCPINILLV